MSPSSFPRVLLFFSFVRSFAQENFQSSPPLYSRLKYSVSCFFVVYVMPLLVQSERKKMASGATPGVNADGVRGVFTNLNAQTIFVNASNLTRSPRFVCGNPACITRTDGAAQLGAAFKRCGRCHSVWYCSPACQRVVWPQHKLECKPMDAKGWYTHSTVQFCVGCCEFCALLICRLRCTQTETKQIIHKI